MILWKMQKDGDSIKISGYQGRGEGDELYFAVHQCFWFKLSGKKILF